MTLAVKLGWTKSQVDEQDAGYIEELVVALAARAEVEEEEAKKADMKAKAR